MLRYHVVREEHRPFLHEAHRAFYHIIDIFAFYRRYAYDFFENSELVIFFIHFSEKVRLHLVYLVYHKYLRRRDVVQQVDDVFVSRSGRQLIVDDEYYRFDFVESPCSRIRHVFAELCPRTVYARRVYEHHLCIFFYLFVGIMCIDASYRISRCLRLVCRYRYLFPQDGIQQR